VRSGEDILRMTKEDSGTKKNDKERSVVIYIHIHKIYNTTLIKITQLNSGFTVSCTVVITNLISLKILNTFLHYDCRHMPSLYLYSENLVHMMFHTKCVNAEHKYLQIKK
jgi:hypothetical protein